MRLVLVAPLLLAIALGCGGGGVSDVMPTYANYSARLDLLIGKPINVAMRVLGPPTRTVAGALGSTLYVWEEKSDLHTPITGQEQYDPQTRTDTIVIHPSQRVPLDCTTSLEADAAGIVTHHRTEGVACVSLPPDEGFIANVAAAAGVPETTAPVTAPAPVRGAAALPAVPAPEGAAPASGLRPAAGASGTNAARVGATRAEQRERRQAERKAKRERNE